MRSVITLATVAVIALTGCGGGGGDDVSDQGSSTSSTEPAAPASSQGKAVAGWATDAQSYSDDFRNCGGRANPTRDFFASCTKGSRNRFRRAEQRAVRAVTRSRTAACRRVRRRLKGVMARTGAALERAVLGFDRSNNAALENRSPTGPPPQQLYLQAAQALETGVAQAKSLSRQIDAGC